MNTYTVKNHDPGIVATVTLKWGTSFDPLVQHETLSQSGPIPQTTSWSLI